MKAPLNPRELSPRLTPRKLSEAPERGPLEALRAVLDITDVALVTANPELLDDGWSAMPERGHIAFVRAAHKILMRGHALRQELDRYSLLLDRQHDRPDGPSSDDIPF